MAATVTVAVIPFLTGKGEIQAAKEADVALGSVNPKLLIPRQGRSEMTGSKVERFKKSMKADGYGISLLSMQRTLRDVSSSSKATIALRPQHGRGYAKFR